MRLRIATVLVGHERPVYLEKARKIGALLDATAPDAVREMVIVDNSRPRIEFERVDDRTVIIGGDNSMREFTAWDRGLAHLERTRSNPDFVHFATSAFDALYANYLERFDTRMLEAARAARAVVGHIDHYDEPVEVLGRSSQPWIRTSYFFVPNEAVRAVRSVVSFEDSQGLFSGDPRSPFLPDAPICKRYREYIVSWLTGDGTGQGVVWHSRFDLAEDTLPTFEAKTMAILNEHLLSLRLREAGYPVVDVTWLAGRLDVAPAQEIEWTRPWQNQVAERPV